MRDHRSRKPQNGTLAGILGVGFVVARGFLAAIDGPGILGAVGVFRTVIATACFQPSFAIAWRALAAGRRTIRVPPGGTNSNLRMDVAVNLPPT